MDARDLPVPEEQVHHRAPRLAPAQVASPGKLVDVADPRR
jgi:hypothetical protein